MRHRPEVDGLRAVAVVPVILFHAGIAGFAGGFVGVDVFFVISGYLITGLLIDEMTQTGKVSIRGFYERRARRILPALFFVFAVIAGFAAVLLPPYQLIEFGNNALGVAAFASNVTLWLQGGYFGGPADSNPLLHTWSLAVEEQYYILFPLVLLAAWKLARRPGVITLILLMIGVSLALAEVATRIAPTANFYLLPTRAWELGLGAAAVAFFNDDRAVGRAWRDQGLSLAGLALVMVSVVAFDESVPFPSAWALVPTLGTVLILIFARPSTLVGRVLSTRPFVAVGLVSYSAYLWHQPLFALYRVAVAEAPSLPILLAFSTLSLVLGWVSWRFVERPFRNRGFLTRRAVFGLSLAGLLAIAGFGLALRATDGFIDRYPAHVQGLLRYSTLQRGEATAAAFNETIRDRAFAPRPAGATSPRRLLIIGDSFAQDFYNVIRATGAFAAYDISADYIAARCQIQVLGAQVQDFIDPGDVRRCGLADNRITEDTIARAQQADVVILVSFWQAWAAERLPQTLAALDLPAQTRLFVIGSKNFGAVDLAALARLSAQEMIDRRVEADAETQAINQILHDAAPAGAYVDMMAAYCEPTGGCRQFTPAGALISYDGRHLTPEGAAFLGASVLAGGALGALAHGVQP